MKNYNGVSRDKALLVRGVWAAIKSLRADLRRPPTLQRQRRDTSSLSALSFAYVAELRETRNWRKNGDEHEKPTIF